MRNNLAYMFDLEVVARMPHHPLHPMAIRNLITIEFVQGWFSYLLLLPHLRRERREWLQLKTALLKGHRI